MKNNFYRKSLPLTCAAMLALSLCACSSATADSTKTEEAVDTETESLSETESSEDAELPEIPNPWTDCATADEAAGIAGFDFSYPESICDDTYTISSYQAMEGMIDAIYSNGEYEITIRQASLTEEDISGDYTEYAQIEEGEYMGISYTMKENDGLVYLTLYNTDQMSYVIYTENGSPAEDIMPIMTLVSSEASSARKVDETEIDALAISGLYESADFGSLSVNIYSSTDPSMVSIGCVYVEDQSGSEYIHAAEIIPTDEVNVYTIDGTNLSFSIYTDENGTLCADVFADDCHAAYLTRTQHFQS